MYIYIYIQSGSGGGLTVWDNKSVTLVMKITSHARVEGEDYNRDLSAQWCVYLIACEFMY